MPAERQRRIRRQEEELGVLDRLLRHNLRNEMNVVQGHAELLAERLENTGAREQLDNILETTQTILDRSEKARRVRTAHSHSAPEGAVDLASLARDVVEEARNRYPDAEVHLDAPETLRARADEVFRYALSELVENAVEHNDADTPRSASPWRPRTTTSRSGSRTTAPASRRTSAPPSWRARRPR